MGKFLQWFCLMLLVSAAAYGQVGEVQGRVTDADTGEAIPFANVVTKVNGSITGAQTDFDGFYTIKPITPGDYDFEVSFIGYQKSLTTGVLVSADKITFLNIELAEESAVLQEIVVKEYKVPLLKADETSTGATMTKDDIENLPTRNVNSIASTSAGVYQEDEGSGVNVKGTRDNATVYYIDGIKVTGLQALPANAIQQMSVVTGGVPARYGDATGGIINITTAGPSNSFGGGLEVLSSQFLDPFNYNLFGANLSGPLLRKGKGTPQERPLLGFFLSGEYITQLDDDPSAVGMWKLKDDVLAEIEQNPLQRSDAQTGLLKSAEFLKSDDFENVAAKQNVFSSQLRGNAKLDFQPVQNIGVTLGGSIVLDDRNLYSYNRSMMNSKNNGHRARQNFRGFLRFTQRFNNREIDDSEGGETNASWLQNAYYSVQLDYTNFRYRFEDPFHEDRFFDYGYVGKFTTFRTEDYAQTELADFNLGAGHVLQGYRDTLVTYEAGGVNPILDNYNNQYFELAGDEKDLYYSTPFQILGNQGLLNGFTPGTAYSMYLLPGYQYDYYGKGDEEQYRVMLNASVDVKKPGGTSTNKHALEFGFEYEQRINRRYNMEPMQLWTIMDQSVNNQLQLDLSNPILRIDGQDFSVEQYEQQSEFIFGVNDTITYNYHIPDAGSQTFFDQQLRSRLGVGATDFIDVNSLDRSVFSLDMFTPDELFRDGNNELTTYYGYDYLGNKLTDQPAFADFWTAKDANGNFTRPMGAFRPIYIAGYIQDKFAFRDMIFNVGVRVDRFDANQKVLRDPYSLYAVRTAEEVDGNLNPLLGAHPGTIGNDFVVYVDNEVNPNEIKGYRDQDQWYNAEGQAVSDPQVLSASGSILPYLKSPLSDNPKNDIKSESFDANTAFKDYEPQISVMPRIAFSFNISDEAIFYAHYDVLTQRPTSRWIATPFDYYFMQERAVDRVFNNPNLQPSRTIDYQVGFKQKLTSSSALTIAAFYKELKDMIQVTSVPFAYPRTYRTYGNEDFGTVKGFEFTYDLRRTGNVKLTANYTLQFAEGTGSDDSFAADLIRFGQPNLKSIVPFSYDSRHLINVVLDYRYGEGKNYNGPRIGELDLFANAGINFIARARSGEPYSRQLNPLPEILFGVNSRSTLDGAINGSRLPWNVKFDVRVDKDFKLAFGKEKGKSAKYLNVYLQVMNLLNTRNIVGVYPYTGSPNDDGYINSAIGAQDVEGQIDPVSFTDYYATKVENPSNYSLPRRIRLGARFNF